MRFMCCLFVSKISGIPVGCRRLRWAASGVHLVPDALAELRVYADIPDALAGTAAPVTANARTAALPVPAGVRRLAGWTCARHPARGDDRVRDHACRACAFATLCVPSTAADLGPDYRSGVRHARTTLYYSNWRDRCAYAGFYCLYAWDGYIYSYPWDDRPSTYAYRRHHRRHIY
jgi:hypothetical protein